MHGKGYLPYKFHKGFPVLCLYIFKIYVYPLKAFARHYVNQLIY